MASARFDDGMRNEHADVDQACGPYDVEKLQHISQFWVLGGHRDAMRSEEIDRCVQVALYPVGVYVKLEDDVSLENLNELRARWCDKMRELLRITALPYTSDKEKVNHPQALLSTTHHLHVGDMQMVFSSLGINKVSWHNCATLTSCCSLF